MKTVNTPDKKTSILKKSIIAFCAATPMLFSGAVSAQSKMKDNPAHTNYPKYQAEKDQKLKKELNKANADWLDIDLSRKFSAVGTGPFFGIGAEYDASDLVIMQSGIGKDLNLLKLNQRIAQYTGEKDGPRSPYVQLSGFFEAQGVYQDQSKSNLDLTGATLDVTAWANKWTTGYMQFGIDSEEGDNPAYRLNLGFVTLGNLDAFPVYLSAGQMYIPFGLYSTSSSYIKPLTRNIGRTQARAVSLSYYPGNGFEASAAIYNGKANYAKAINSDKSADHYAGRVMYNKDFDLVGIPSKVKIGTSYTNNVLDSYTTRFNLASNAPLRHYVPAYDVFAKFTVGPYSVSGEYLSALDHLDQTIATQGGKKIRPEAYHVEAEYLTYIMGKGTSFSFNYSEAFRSAIVKQVQHQFGVNCTVNIFKNTYVSAEYSHRKNYASSQVLAAGTNGSTGVFASAATLAPAGTIGSLNNNINGKKTNLVAGTLTLFF